MSTEIEQLKAICAFFKNIDDCDGDDGGGYSYAYQSEEYERKIAEFEKVIAKLEWVLTAGGSRPADEEEE